MSRTPSIHVAIAACFLLSACGGDPVRAPDGSAPECSTDPDCVGPSSFCSAPVCDGGRCVQRILQASGTALPSQRYGDCVELRCGERGDVVAVPVDDDPFDDSAECTDDRCVNGIPVHLPKAQGYLCTSGICAAGGECVQCIPGVASCTIAQNVCLGGVCAAPTCQNGAKDPGEADVDCGGPCPRCQPNQACIAGPQCTSDVCAGGKCLTPTCMDGRANGDETTTDCGGSCQPCPTDAPCRSHADCQSWNCTEGFCLAPSCADAVRNGDESGTDCGGSCPACP